MINPVRKIIFAGIPLLTLLGILESLLYIIDYRGTSIADIQSTSGFQQNAYVQRRDRILGNWFLEKDNQFSSNPYLLARGFHDQSFTKDPNQKRRYFALGGSTTYGSPFEHQAKGFPQRIEETLNQHSTDNWEIINLGVAGMDSASFPKIIEEISSYQAEGILIYAGNNEIRGALTAQCSNPYRIGIEKQVNRLRTIQLMRDQFRRFSNVTVHFDHLAERQDDCMKREVANIQSLPPVYPERYPLRSDAHYQMVLQQFQDHLQRSIDLASQQRLKVFLAIPPINLLEPPADQTWNTQLPPETESQLQQRLQDDSIDWKQLTILDPTFALASHQYGKELIDNENALGLEYLQRSVSQDLLSKRITPELQLVIRNLCNDNPTIHCIDISAAFKQNLNEKLADDDLFEDFCHPTFDKGTTLIADQFIQAMQ